MFVLRALVAFTVSLFVDAVPLVFKESTPNGESIVAISSSDPNVEKYFSQQFATRSGFTQVNDEEQNRAYNNQPGPPQGTVHSSFSIAVPGKALAGAGRSIASASSGPFVPLFNFPIIPEGFGFNNFDLKDWVRNVESFYNPAFAGNGHVNSATAINDNGHVYGNVNAVSFDNRAKAAETYDNVAKIIPSFDNRAKTPETFYNGDKNISSFDKRAKNAATFDNNGSEYSKY